MACKFLAKLTIFVIDGELVTQLLQFK